MQIEAVHPRVLWAASLIGVTVFAVATAALGAVSAGPLAGASFALLAGLGAAGGLIVGFQRNLWRTRAGQVLWPTPDFSGRWEGWHASEAGDEWRPAVHEITQTGDTVRIVVLAGGSRDGAAVRTRAESLASAIRRAPAAQRPELHWTFRSLGLDDAAAAPHEGALCLGLFSSGGAQFLDGFFVSNAARTSNAGVVTAGATGRVLVKRTTHALRGALDYREEDWAMPRPQGPPSLTDTDDLVDISIRTPVMLMGRQGGH
ncbi:hypothetical protein GCM10007036_02700 [Alsobacter metallidurans]|uniref:Uncharacterized protein n=1 Tax=Alsobacter metallidurans TaxID=340221 RepID=A0A917I3S4_9HYPH|nr:hypothetical protein [Alsobacter metallidurans]GGH07704.1 hypothetical protein GCM10007036_02700 [Alsobacter metallidurans]